MARRLTAEEEHLFNELLKASESGLTETITDPLLRLILERTEAGAFPDLDIGSGLGPGTQHKEPV